MNKEIEHEPSVRRMKRDIAVAAATMSPDEARFLVDAYYISQEDRKRAHNQVRAMNEEPHVVIAWLAEQGNILEGQIKNALDKYTDAHVVGRWLKSIYGVGPVIAAGMMAHIDIRRARTVGHIYSFAGIAGQRRCQACGWMLTRGKEAVVVDEDEGENPHRLVEELCPNCGMTLSRGGGQTSWTKGQKRPFNAGLKTLCWKTGQCFMKFSGEEECVYGAKFYLERKAFEVARNERGDNASDAKQILAAKKFDKKTEAFKHLSAGRLPPAQIDGRARRFAVKIFLSHVHCVMFWLEYKTLPPNPYALDHLGHTHFIKLPNVDLVPGLEEALRGAGLI